MDDLKNFLNQSKKFINGAPIPYETKYNFLDKYPFEVKQIPIPEWVRLDGLAKEVSGSEYGWKLICIFNSVINPLDLFNRDYIYLPANFLQAINWIKTKNLRTK